MLSSACYFKFQVKPFFGTRREMTHRKPIFSSIIFNPWTTGFGYTETLSESWFPTDAPGDKYHCEGTSHATADTHVCVFAVRVSLRVVSSEGNFCGQSKDYATGGHVRNGYSSWRFSGQHTADLSDGELGLFCLPQGSKLVEHCHNCYFAPCMMFCCPPGHPNSLPPPLW